MYVCVYVSYHIKPAEMETRSSLQLSFDYSSPKASRELSLSDLKNIWKLVAQVDF